MSAKDGGQVAFELKIRGEKTILAGGTTAIDVSIRDIDKAINRQEIEIVPVKTRRVAAT